MWHILAAHVAVLSMRLVATVQYPSVVLPCARWNILDVGRDPQNQNPLLHHDRSASGRRDERSSAWYVLYCMQITMALLDGMAGTCIVTGVQLWPLRDELCGGVVNCRRLSDGGSPNGRMQTAAWLHRRWQRRPLPVMA